MVGFCDLVRTGIAPVSKKTAVKGTFEKLDQTEEKTFHVQETFYNGK